MARQKNDGRGRMGGRAKGTPNKRNSTLKAWLAELIDGNREQVEADLKALKPLARLQMLEKMLSYVLPKMQSVSASVNFDKLTNEQLDQVVTEVTRGISDED